MKNLLSALAAAGIACALPVMSSSAVLADSYGYGSGGGGYQSGKRRVTGAGAMEPGVVATNYGGDCSRLRERRCDGLQERLGVGAGAVAGPGGGFGSGGGGLQERRQFPRFTSM